MKKPVFNQECVDTLYDARFLKLYDMRYAEGKHYFNVSRRAKQELVGLKSDGEFQSMLPDAVTIAVVLHFPDGASKLLMSYEYRYPVGQFQLSPVAGLIDPEDKEEYLKLREAEAKALEDSSQISDGNERLKAAYEAALFQAAVREIKEEAGLDFKDGDSIRVLNPCAFSSPGMTDESNAFLCADIHVEDTSSLNQSGAVGGELFDGFELLDREQAARIYRSGRDSKGNFFSLAAWAVLGYFLQAD